MVQQHAQQPVLGARQRYHRARGIEQVACRGVQPPVAKRKVARGLGHGQVGRQHARAPQHCVDARQQLARGEGFGQVVVRTQLQAQDAVGLVAARGEHDDGQRRRAGTAQLTAQGDAVSTRQHQVQHQQIDALRGQHLAHLPPVGGHAHLQALALQVFGSQFADAGVVIDDQDVVGRGRRHGGHCPGFGVRAVGRLRARMYLNLSAPCIDKRAYQKPLARQIADNCAGFNAVFLNFTRTLP